MNLLKSFIKDADGYTIKDHIAVTLLTLFSLSVFMALTTIIFAIFNDEPTMFNLIEYSLQLVKYLIGLNGIIIPFYFGTKTYDAHIKNKTVDLDNRG